MLYYWKITLIFLVILSGGTAGYTNWNWNGVWERNDYDCAYIDLEGFWHHTNCHDELNYVCEIPMF